MENVIPEQKKRNKTLFARIKSENYQWLKGLSQKTNWTLAETIDLLIDKVRKEKPNGKEKKA